MTVPLELHLTCGELQGEEALSAFLATCTQAGCKPLLLELPRGQQARQPMATTWLRGDLDTALAAATGLAERFAGAGLPVARVKIESAIQGHEHPDRVDQYFEWHGKLALHDAAALQCVCESHGAHLSRNSLKGETGMRFVTLRSRAPLAIFREQVAALAERLQREGWPLRKQEFEFCLHDSRESLDAGWLECVA